MNLIADESVDFNIILHLRKNGYMVFSISEDSPGISDDAVLKIALEKESIVLTEDKDFGELVYRFKRKNMGIILIRLIGVEVEVKLKIIQEVFEKYFAEMNHKFTIIGKDNIRIRNIEM